VETLTGIIKEIWNLFMAMSVYLVFGFLVAGIVSVFLKPEKIFRHFGNSGFSSILKAVLFGVPLPLCSCGVLPPAAGLYKSGASKGSTLAFLISTPTTGIDSIIATYGLMGGIFMILRILASVVIGIVAGIVSDIFSGEKDTAFVKQVPEISCSSSGAWIKEALRFGFVEVYQSTARWIFLGVIIGGLISYLVPENILSMYAGNRWMTYLIMLVVGLPLYVCATGSIPIAASLAAKGISPGACLVFLIAGPATNTVTMLFVGKTLGKKHLIIYLVSIVLGALIFGLLLDNILINYNLSIQPFHHSHNKLFEVLSLVCSFVLIGISIVSVFTHMLSTRKKGSFCFVYNVPDISCQNCVRNIKNVLLTESGIKSVKVDVKSKKVTICADFNDDKKLKQLLDQAGYPASE